MNIIKGYGTAFIAALLLLVNSSYGVFLPSINDHNHYLKMLVSGLVVVKGIDYILGKKIEDKRSVRDNVHGYKESIERNVTELIVNRELNKQALEVLVKTIEDKPKYSELVENLRLCAPEILISGGDAILVIEKNRIKINDVFNAIFKRQYEQSSNERCKAISDRVQDILGRSPEYKLTPDRDAECCSVSLQPVYSHPFDSTKVVFRDPLAGESVDLTPGYQRPDHIETKTAISRYIGAYTEQKWLDEPVKKFYRQEYDKVENDLAVANQAVRSLETKQRLLRGIGGGIFIGAGTLFAVKVFPQVHNYLQLTH